MNVSSPPLRRNYIISAIIAAIGLGLILAVLILGGETMDAGEVTGIFFGCIFAFLFAPAILLKAKRIDLDQKELTITYVLTRRKIRYLHSEMTGADYWLNMRVETSSSVRYIHVIEFIPTGEPIIRMTSDTHGNFEAMLHQVVAVYGKKARDVSGNQAEGF